MNSKVLKRELRAQFYRKNTVPLAIAFFAALALGTMNLILSWLIQQLIDTASGLAGALPLPALARLSSGFLLICILSMLLDYASGPSFMERAMRQYKEFAFQKLMEKNISSFGQESTAAYLSSLSNDASSIEADYLEQLLKLATKVIMFIGALAMMLWYSPLLTLIAAVLTILPFAASVLTGSRLEAAQRRVSDRNTDFTSALKDCLGGFTVVKSFKAEKEIFALFAQSNRALEKEKFTMRRIKKIIGMIGSIAGIFAQLGVFLAGAYLALADRGLTPGVVIMFVNLMNFMIEPIAELPGLLASRRAATGLIGKLADALEKNSSPQNSREMDRLKTRICLDRVSFGYGPEKEVLHEISAVFEAGGAYAVVGGSGSGKSTLLNLLMGSGMDYSGQILFDDTELRELDSGSLYGMISMIQQNVFVFQASIEDNITMFRSFPQEEIRQAISHAHLNELLADHDGSYLCGENGKGLSGGERQRISIARSLLKKSSVLLADEATAALDAKTAWQVSNDILDQEGILRIVVTHTLEEALLRRYDGILVLRDGRIEERGTFEELMEKKGYFYALYTVAQ